MTNTMLTGFNHKHTTFVSVVQPWLHNCVIFAAILHKQWAWAVGVYAKQNLMFCMKLFDLQKHFLTVFLKFVSFKMCIVSSAMATGIPF